MRRYYKAMERDPFEVIPVTFHVKKGSSDPEFLNFLAFYQDIEEKKVEAAEQTKEMQVKKEVLEKEIVSLDEKLKELNKGIKFSFEEAKEEEEGGEKNEPGEEEKKQDGEDEHREGEDKFLPEVKAQPPQKDLVLDETLLRKMQVKKRQIVRDQERLTVEKRRATV